MLGERKNTKEVMRLASTHRGTVHVPRPRPSDLQVGAAHLQMEPPQRIVELLEQMGWTDFEVRFNRMVDLARERTRTEEGGRILHGENH